MTLKNLQSQQFIFSPKESTSSITKTIPYLYPFIDAFGDSATRVLYLIEQARLILNLDLCVTEFFSASELVAVGIWLKNDSIAYILTKSADNFIKIAEDILCQQYNNQYLKFFLGPNVDMNDQKKEDVAFNFHQDTLLTLAINQVLPLIRKSDYKFQKTTLDNINLLSYFMEEYEKEIYTNHPVNRVKDYYRQRAAYSILYLDYFLLSCGDEVIGYIGTSASARNVSHLAEIWIHPYFRGKGLAEVLVSQCVYELSKKNINRIVLQTGHPAAIKIYQRLGAQITGAWTTFRTKIRLSKLSL